MAAKITFVVVCIILTSFLVLYRIEEIRRDRLFNLVTASDAVFDVTQHQKLNAPIYQTKSSVTRHNGASGRVAETPLERVRFVARAIDDDLLTFVDSIELHAAVSVRSAPARDILYLKTHKTGSETMSAMFKRYGLGHQLSFAVPRGFTKTANNLGWPWPFSATYVRPTVSGTYNILCEHSIFTPDAQYAIMNESVLTVVTVREPFDHLRSAFTYFEMASRIPIRAADPLAEFLLDLRGYDRTLLTKSGLCVPQSVSVACNAQALDLGFALGFAQSSDMSNNNTYITQFLRSISRLIDVPLVLEHFDESLVLMRRLLAWSIKDILYLVQNKSVYSKHHGYDPQLVQNVRNWKHVDTLIYRLLNRTLWWHIGHYDSEDFRGEVQNFQDVLREVTGMCDKAERDGHVSWYNEQVAGTFAQSRWTAAFELTFKDCYMLANNLRAELRQSMDNNQFGYYEQEIKASYIPGC